MLLFYLEEYSGDATDAHVNADINKLRDINGIGDIDGLRDNADRLNVYLLITATNCLLLPQITF